MSGGVEAVPYSGRIIYDWGYERRRRELVDLYEKAKRSQWSAADVLPWDRHVDVERPGLPDWLNPIYGTDIHARLTPKEDVKLQAELNAWSLSQFLHGEQGALLAASQLVVSVPDTESKFYAATQAVDEARHVEVFDRYLREKIGILYPPNPHLKRLLDLILCDSRWDVKLLGMQIIVEGLALAAFDMVRQSSREKLLKQITHYVVLDEARHVAYGILALRDYYADASEAEVREREDFIYESVVLMRDRFLFQEVWEKLGMPAAECMAIARESERQKVFRQLLFSKVVPAVKKIGLLSERQRARFAELGILHFEAAEEPTESA
jgi:hypothetical protein